MGFRSLGLSGERFLGDFVGRLGAPLGRLGAILSVVEPSFGVSGPSLGRPEGLLRPSGPFLELSRSRKSHLGRRQEPLGTRRVPQKIWQFGFLALTKFVRTEGWVLGDEAQDLRTRPLHARRRGGGQASLRARESERE